MSKQIYGASTIKRIRRTSAQVAMLDSQIVDVLANDHPQSVRHIYYRMTDPRLHEPVEKTDAGYRTVQNRCLLLRRSGAIPYGWISDMSRHGYSVNTFDDGADFIRRMSGLYRGDMWRDADVRCEVWCESRSIASVLLADCKELAVNLYPCGGFSSVSFVHAAAQEHSASDDDRPLQVLYVGDYDPAGVLIDVSLQKELREHLRADIELRFERIGINADQVIEFDLPTKPRKDGDKRSNQVERTVEAEAMPAHILRSIVHDRIESLLPADALAVSKVAEQSEREHLRSVARMMKGGRI
jgi:hypothetical protein